MSEHTGIVGSRLMYEPEWPNIGDVMSNFDHAVCDGMEDKLRAAPCVGDYPAWNFHGLVWFDGEQFACEVWVYHSPQKVVRAATLPLLIEACSDEYGHD